MHGTASRTRLSRRVFLRRTSGVVGAGALAASGLLFSRQRTVLAGAGWNPGDLVVVATDALNLRSEATRASAIVATYPSGTTATILDQAVQADDLIWVHVQITDDGNLGWFATPYLTVATGNGEGWTPGSPVFVNTDALNFRDAPSLSDNVLGVYPWGSGATVVSGPVSGDGYLWYQVTLYAGGATGWFAADFLTLGVVDGDPGDVSFTVIDGPLNLRGEAGLDGAILRTYPTGATGVALTQESVLVDGYMWALMRMDEDGRQGWLALDFISF